MGTYITKYRPQTFDDVVGQAAAVKSLRATLGDRSSHTFLLSGPSGVGKTTLARLSAAELGCSPSGLLEINAANHTGVDDMREILLLLGHRPLGSPVMAIIVDEAQRLSRNAWDSILKPLEEPPEWVFWFLCTTEPQKVPKNIQTRCTTYSLKEVPSGVLEEMLGKIADAEELDVDDAVLQVCAREASGSPRQALANLAVCAEAESAKAARELLRSAEEEPGAFELAQALVRGAPWSEVQQLLSDLGDVSPESARHVVRAYVTKVVLGTSKEDAAGRGLEILDAFSEPFNPHDGVTPLVLACGRVLLS